MCVAFDPSEGGRIVRASWWLTEDAERVSRIVAQRPDVEDQLRASPGLYVSPVLPCTRCLSQFLSIKGPRYRSELAPRCSSPKTTVHLLPPSVGE